MACRPQKFIAIATALVVFATHVACLCDAARARGPVETRSAPHKCCKQEQNPKPAPAPKNPCQHCGDITIAAPAAKSDGIAPAHALVAMAQPVADGACHAIAFAGPDFALSSPPGVPPPTLLRLHCALNL